VRRLSAVWICGLALVMMLFTLHIPGLRPWQTLLVTVNALTLAGVSAYQLLSRFSVSYRKLFVFFNIMLGNHMLILAVAHIAM
jgi:hypothetical protein